MHFRPRVCCVVVFIHLRMETPLRGRSGGHTGAAPTVSFGWIAGGRLISFGQIAGGRLISFGLITRKWLFCLCGLRGKIWWRWVGAVPVYPPVSPCKGAYIVHLPAHNACIFGMETSLRGRSGGHAGAAPTVSLDVVRWMLMSFGQITRGTVGGIWLDCA